ncbi:MAG: hypothetical protein KDA71_22625, partial [Planctomycetales bacterium]|nr:hypothetical protein [Planctomycetales bacterium]
MPKSKFAIETSAARRIEARICQRMNDWTRTERRLGGFDQLHRVLAATCDTDADWKWFVDQFSRAVAAAAVVMQILPAVEWPAGVHDWLIDKADPLTRAVLKAAQVETTQIESPLSELAASSGELTDAAIYWVETYLAKANARERMRRGVFFTPRSVARYIVEQVDRRLRDDFGCRSGFAGWMPAERGGLLEPALGTGVFLCEFFRRLRRSAVKFLPADAGSIGHVVDAASVPMGTFSSAARPKANLREWQRERNVVSGMVASQG